MKVLHVVQSSLPILAGYTIRTKYLVENQRLNGLEPFVITSPYHSVGVSEEGANPEVIDGVKYYRTSRHNTLNKGDPTPVRLAKRYIISRKYSQELERVCSIEKPDIIHAHSDYMNGLNSGKAGRKHGIPVIYEVRGLWADAAVANAGLGEGSLKYRFTYFMNKRAFDIADHICCLGETLREEILSRGVDPAKVSVVHNGVDFRSFRPVPKDVDLAKTLGLSGALVLGFVGSVRRLEGLGMLIETLPELLHTTGKIGVLIVGDGEPELSSLKELASQKEISQRCVFTGRVSHDEILKYYSLIDIMVYPRLNMKINQKVTPLKPLEAMAMGKVVLASDVGGLAELVNDGKTGILFKAEDKDNFIRKCRKLIEDEDLRASLISRASNWVRDERDWAKIVGQYGPVYEKTILAARDGGKRRQDR